MDPYTLGYLAGHGYFATTKRYHPQPHTIRDAKKKPGVGIPMKERLKVFQGKRVG
jgi:hypothetical protein